MSILENYRLLHGREIYFNHENDVHGKTAICYTGALGTLQAVIQEPYLTGLLCYKACKFIGLNIPPVVILKPVIIKVSSKI